MAAIFTVAAATPAVSPVEWAGAVAAATGSLPRVPPILGRGVCLLPPPKGEKNLEKLNENCNIIATAVFVGF